MLVSGTAYLIALGAFAAMPSLVGTVASLRMR